MADDDLTSRIEAVLFRIENDLRALKFDLTLLSEQFQLDEIRKLLESLQRDALGRAGSRRQML